MNGKWLPVLAAALIVVGLLGLAGSAIGRHAWEAGGWGQSGGRAPGAGFGRRAPQPSVDLGERIYTQGRGDGGRWLNPRSGRGMMGRACADCHGADGRGREIGMMMGSIRTPDVRYSTLTNPATEGTETVEPWTDSDIARAVREGVEPDGEQLAPTMPRWELTDDEMRALLEYLKQL